MQVDFKILSYKAQENLKFKIMFKLARKRKNILSQRASALANAKILKIKI